MVSFIGLPMPANLMDDEDETYVKMALLLVTHFGGLVLSL